MRRFVPLLLAGLLAACGAADQLPPAAQPTRIPVVPLASATAPAATSAPVMVAMPPIPTAVPSPQPLAKIAIENALVQPGDLPDEFTAGDIQSAMLDGLKMKDMVFPDWTIERTLIWNGKPTSTSFVRLYHYADASAALAMYSWFQSRADSQRPNVALPDIGGQARLYVPISATDDWALFFATCRAAVEIRMEQTAERAVVLNYAQRLAQRLLAAECASAPQPTSAPAPEPAPPQARVTDTISATVVRLPDPGGDQFIRAYSFADANHGWLYSGGALFATEDGGQHWTQTR